MSDANEKVEKSEKQRIEKHSNGSRFKRACKLFKSLYLINID